MNRQLNLSRAKLYTLLPYPWQANTEEGFGKTKFSLETAYKCKNQEFNQKYPPLMKPAHLLVKSSP